MRRGRPAYFFFSNVARYQYGVADRIGVQSPGNHRQFRERYPKYAEKVEVLWNWRATPVQATSGLPFPVPKDRVVFFYGGNLGVAQGVGHLIALARWANARGDAHLIIVGSGMGYARLRRTIDEEQLRNITLSPPVPQDQFDHLLGLSAVGVVLLDTALRTHNIPGKLVSYAMAGKPILADVNASTDLIDLLQVHRAGLVTCGDETEFLANARRLAEDPELRGILGTGALHLARSQFSVERCVAQLLRLGDDFAPDR
jgi:glycosyltransferase involved in cell wall biosynthesis